MIFRGKPRTTERVGLTNSALFLAAYFLVACGPPTVHYSNRTRTALPLIKCVEASCSSTAMPFLLGGNDYSPPTLKNIARWQRGGHFANVPYNEIQRRYRENGFSWTESGLPCNCRCDGTKHAALGGKCLDPPVPGTPEHSAVHIGL